MLPHAFLTLTSITKRPNSGYWSGLYVCCGDGGNADCLAIQERVTCCRRTDAYCIGKHAFNYYSVEMKFVSMEQKALGTSDGVHCAALCGVALSEDLSHSIVQLSCAIVQVQPFASVL